MVAASRSTPSFDHLRLEFATRLGALAPQGDNLRFRSVARLSAQAPAAPRRFSGFAIPPNRAILDREVPDASYPHPFFHAQTRMAI